jgi:hypothetical protein
VRHTGCRYQIELRGSDTTPTLMEEEGRGAGERRVREEMSVGEWHRVEEMCRVEEMRVGEEWTSARSSSSVVADGDARVSRRGVTSGRSDASEKGGTSEMSLLSGRRASGTIATRRGGGDDDRGRETRFGGKRLNADLEGDKAYIEPPTFSHGSYSQP